MKGFSALNEQTGLSDSDLKEIISIIEAFPQVEKVFIFGSRAKGTYKRGSDIDIAVSGPEITYSTVNKISYQLNEESSLPYYFDVLDIKKISSEALLQHIKEYGVNIKG